MQTRRQSVVEVVSNTSIGMAGSWAITYVAMSLVADRGLSTTVAVVGCTVWSLVRGYWIRRRFAKLEKS